jgi:hypothetical protein
MRIVHLLRNEIDTRKWDACIGTAANGLIYSTIAYLDAMAPGWSALVNEDYTAVMPLTARSKWGFTYLYQPYLTAQTGVTGSSLPNEVVVDFLNAVPSIFRYWDLSLNWGNALDLLPYKAVMRRNYVLPLDAPHDSIKAAYRNVVKRNVKKALHLGCSVSCDIPLDAVVQLAMEYTPGTRRYMLELDRFRSLFQQLQYASKGIIYGVHTGEGTLVASAVFLFFRDRAYYILVGNHPLGKRTGASHLLIDSFIRDHAARRLTLDFEGSDVPGLAFFYSSFGAKEENYPALTYNRLPWFARWLKT